MPIFDSSFDSSILNSQQNAFTKSSRNVMEVLVVEEVEKQFQSLPAKTAKYIKASEVIAYALNRLPALYATSKRGWQRQWHRGKTEMYQKITTAVRQGIIAVQQDPLRANDLLIFPDEDAASAALQGLKVLLQREDISWENLTDVVKQTLINTSRGKITWRQPGRPDNQLFDWEKHQM
ncbi:Late competence development protein ComFB [Cylindrospermum stagnale PCC 7417]|uniref:Late competence development protein ComFB n=1 Tax=Cylindrospermum stagnale PCC 7417 TaxID=56107 RepID=K9WUV3_9NOST|nr:late competence development ComFB family protein [Cylindrospermum stagnale]AFZ23574.1 Late competence development protein ComFB [Cylindrospermum stagnale PCC 7417]